MIKFCNEFSHCVEEFIDGQLQMFEMFARASRNLREGCRQRDVAIDGGRRKVRLSYNPARSRSSGADLRPQAIASRPCFLCDANRPLEQSWLECGDYKIVVNPFPVVERHLVIIHNDHKPQVMDDLALVDFVTLANNMPGRILFYNGATSGASAPDHLHFQSIPDFRWDSWQAPDKCVIIENGPTAEATAEAVRQALAGLPIVAGEAEPRYNLASLPNEGTGLKFAVIPRKKLRPDCYSADRADTTLGACMVSPATIEMLGLLITPLEKDFNALKAEQIEHIYEEVGYRNNDDSPVLRVGIVSQADSLEVRFNGRFHDGKNVVEGDFMFQADSGSYPRRFYPSDSRSCNFELQNVAIGIDFHWHRLEPQRFAGALSIELHEGKLHAISEIDIENYLISVISSEMSPKASLEFLKAHAVISRSWALAQLKAPSVGNDSRNEGMIETAHEVVRWRDRENHRYFDLCADDHCQRYQGLGRVTTGRASEAVMATRGMVLVDRDGNICDARFSKCCGGKFEVFSTCWQDVDYHYLQPGCDIPSERPHYSPLIDFGSNNADDAVPMCATTRREVLEQVMNNYDCETLDFYRWQVVYAPQELSELLARKSGIDFGEIKSINPLERGASGRIYRLEIVGDRNSIIVGKELEIRRWLSESHLKSSAFDVERDSSGNWVFNGRGWGHGVGLCQIGAAVMALRGYDYRQILAHYFPGSRIASNYGKVQ